MIRTPPQHNTKNPPGQINFPVGQVYPVGTLAKEIEEFQEMQKQFNPATDTLKRNEKGNPA